MKNIKNMKHIIKINIEIDRTTSSHEYSQEVHNKLTKALLADIPESLSFDELEKIILFHGRRYFVTSVEYLRIELDAEETITKFEIKG